MKVILNRDVPNLGEEGDICDVAPGYARNYLLPKGLVMQHNARNLALIGERREQIEKRKEDKRQEAMGLKERLESHPVVVTMRAGANGKLFGSVTNATIAEHLAKDGIDVERKKIDIPDNTIKSLGNYKVTVRLYGDEEASVTVTVHPTADSEARTRQKDESAAPPTSEPEKDETAGEAVATEIADGVEETQEVIEAPQEAAEAESASETDDDSAAEEGDATNETDDDSVSETEREPSAE